MLMWAGLAAIFLLSFLGSGPIPLPLTAVILWMGQFHYPVWVVLAATAGSLLGWLALERFIRRWVHNQPQMIERLPLGYRHIFLKNMGFWLFVFNALPLPLDFVRFLAVMKNYNRFRLAVILTLGRLIRNTLLVAIGAVLAKHQLWLWGVMLAFMLLPLPLGRVLQGGAPVPPAGQANKNARPNQPGVPKISVKSGRL